MLYQLSYTHHGRCDTDVSVAVAAAGEKCTEARRVPRTPATAAGSPGGRRMRQASAGAGPEWSTACLAAIVRESSLLGPGAATMIVSR